MLSTRKVCHITTVHPRYDTRIFLKECRSLAGAGYSVSLIVADGRGDEVRDNVHFYDVGAPVGRTKRILHTTRKALALACTLDADIYHLHDPELLPIGLKLKKMPKTVIFDSHEDVPKQVLSKPYLNIAAKVVISKTFAAYETWACRKLDAVVAATPYIREKFRAINSCVVDVNNFPILGELAEGTGEWGDKQPQVCYVGGISTIRGIRELVQAMALTESGARLQLGGVFGEKGLAAETQAEPGWKFVDELGWLGRDSIRDAFRRSVAGIVTLHPVLNYVDALPVKMFEYMSAGLPVIASDFPLWREIIVGNDCGICVDPKEPMAIAAAVDYVIANPERAAEMGRNGQRAVRERYNWNIEEQKLLELYSRLTSTGK